MRKAVLALLLAVIVLASGCTGGTTEKPETGEVTTSQIQEETPQQQMGSGNGGNQEGSTPYSGSGGGQTTQGAQDLTSIGERVHVETINFNGMSGIEIYVDGATWKSDGNAYNSRFDYAPMFYSGGNLYVYQYADESFSDVYLGYDMTKYPYVVLGVPIQGVDFTFAGPQDSILAVGADGRLYLIVYDLDERKNWPSDEDKRIIYFPKTKRVDNWELNVKHVAAGSEKDDEYVYYVAWNDNEVYVIGWYYEDLLAFTKGEGQKAEAKRFSFDNVKDVLIGRHGIYVLSGDKLYAINIVDGPKGLEISSEVSFGENVQLSLDKGYDHDLVSAYDGETLRLMVFEDGKLDENYRAEIKLEGYDSVHVYLPSSGVEFVALKGSRAYFYTYDFTYHETTLVGYLDLPAKPVWASGYIDGWSVGVVTFWGDDGKYYKLFGTLNTEQAGESTSSGTIEEGESSGAPEESEGGTSEEGTSESEQGTQLSLEDTLKNFLDNAYTVEGLVYSTEGYNYRGIKITPKLGRLDYYPYGYDNTVFQVYEDKVLLISPWGDLDFWGAETDTPTIDPYSQTLILLPAKAKMYYSVPNGDYAAMVDESGKLHILIGLTWHPGEDIDWYTFKSDVVYDFDAEGAYIASYYGNYEYIVWKDNELRIYIYDYDTHYKMWDEGANITVEPLVYTLPGHIRDANPYIGDIGYFIVVLTDEGTYIIPNPLGYYKDDTNIYRIDDRVDLIGAYHYWGIGDLIAYSNGQVYEIEVDYSEYERTVGVQKGPYVSVADVVGLYGDYDQDGYFAVSTFDGRLLVYQNVWNNQKQGYEFVLRKVFYLPAPLVKFTFDYRPDWDWIRILGLGADGSIYNFEIQGAGGS